MHLEVELSPSYSTQTEIESFLTNHWGSKTIIANGESIDASRITRIIARDDSGNLIGLCTIRIHPSDRSCEVVTLDAVSTGKGVGSKLLSKAEELAGEKAAKRIWLITTNDNRPAVSFYEKSGYTLIHTRKGAVAEARKLKPSIPLKGLNGIEITDELIYSKNL